MTQAVESQPIKKRGRVPRPLAPGEKPRRKHVATGGIVGGQAGVSKSLEHKQRLSVSIRAAWARRRLTTI